jgi:ADP-dependent phosphofructokinase/glucokinase
MQVEIALGLGDNTDYEIVWDSKVLEALILQYGIRAGELSVDKTIASERDLVISILGFLQAGSGGERHVAASSIVEAFAQKFAMKITLGGTSVRAAIAMRKLGYTSALHLVTINDHVRRLIPPDSPYVCSNTADSSYPHLIVQFDKGARVRAGDVDICAGRANRIIYHDDTDNVVMRLNEEFAGLITGAKVFLISGFNAMRSEELLADRLAALLRIMDGLPASALVYYEDAGFYNHAFNELIHATLARRISIFSLNEDELQGHLGRQLDLLDALQVADALADLQKRIPVPIIVVHSMYWALAYGANAPRVASALKGGVTMATTRFRYGDDFTVENYREIERVAPNGEGAQFAGALKKLLGDHVCCVPVAQVEQSNGTTIGLGDAFVGGFLPALLAS